MSPNFRGAAFMAISMAVFTVNDAIMKSVGGEMNMGQAMLIRGLVATAIIGTMCAVTGALQTLRHALHGIVLVRAAADGLVTITYLIALQHIPLASTVAIYQALPIAVTLGAMVFYNEYVGWRRWLAIGFSFLGVLIVVQPGTDAFSPYAILLLVGIALAATRDLLMRKIPAEVPSALISLTNSFSVTLFGAVLVQPMGGWVAPSGTGIAVLVMAAVLLSIGYQFFIASTRLGEISFVAPFRYSSLLWGCALGYLMFGEIPDVFMLIGSVMILSAGFYMLYRERVVRKARNAAVSAAKSPPPGLA